MANKLFNIPGSTFHVYIRRLILVLHFKASMPNPCLDTVLSIYTLIGIPFSMYTVIAVPIHTECIMYTKFAVYCSVSIMSMCNDCISSIVNCAS